MIFLTVGGQLPFDRLVKTVDEWAGQRARNDVFAQIGEAASLPSNLSWEKFLTPAEFDERLRSADAIVAHAGMGTILTAIDYAKPIVVMPRIAALGEQRNDHQMATAERLADRELVRVAMDESALLKVLDEIDELVTTPAAKSPGAQALLATIREFLDGSPSAAASTRRRA